MNNGIFTTSWKVLGESVLTAIVAAILTAIVAVAVTNGFNVFTANWAMIGQGMVNIGFIAGVTTLGKDFLSTNSGSLLAVGPVPPSTN